jgi:hypothetical protein
VIEKLGLPDNKQGMDQAGRILGKAKEELGITVGAGSRYTQAQTNQTTAWLELRTQAQSV